MSESNTPQAENTAHPEIVAADQWRAARLRHLEHEKKLTVEMDRLRAQRRRLPMEKVTKDYAFEGTAGKLSLSDLFEGRRQLIVYHFMFDPDWHKGCTGCTGYIDALGDLSMLAERNTTFVVISRAPLARLQEYKQARGWDINWVSSFGSDFNYDYHVTMDEKVRPVEYNYRSKAELESRKITAALRGEQPGVSVFFRLGSDVFHTYSAYARGTESQTDSYALLDLTPYGRQESFEDSPAGWPQKPTYG